MSDDPTYRTIFLVSVIYRICLFFEATNSPFPLAVRDIPPPGAWTHLSPLQFGIFRLLGLGLGSVLTRLAFCLKYTLVMQRYLQ